MGSCEEMAEKLSAWMDGELEAQEIPRLLEHLASCPACRRRRDGFRAVDGMVKGFNASPGPELKTRILRSMNLPGHLAGRPRPGLRRLFSVAAAALILIAVSLIILVTGDQAAAGRAAARMIALETLNKQAVKDQEALLKTMEWDLSAMELMVGCSDLDEKASRALLDRIEALMDEVEKISSGHPETGQGDQK